MANEAYVAGRPIPNFFNVATKLASLYLLGGFLYSWFAIISNGINFNPFLGILLIWLVSTSSFSIFSRL